MSLNAVDNYMTGKCILIVRHKSLYNEQGVCYILYIVIRRQFIVRRFNGQNAISRQISSNYQRTSYGILPFFTLQRSHSSMNIIVDICNIVL